MKLLLIVFALALSLPAFADELTYHMTLTTAATFNGQPASGGMTEWNGMVLKDVYHVRARAAGVPSLLSKMKDKGGPYTVTLTEVVVDSNGEKTSTKLVYPGLGLQDMVNMMIAEQKVGAALIADAQRQINSAKNVRSRSAMGAAGDPANKLPWGK